MLDLTGKTALVTGGSRGIGRAIVLKLAQQGADIAFMDRGAPETAAQTKADVEAHRPAGHLLRRRRDGPRGLHGLRPGGHRGLRQGRHPRQQRRHHARRPRHADGHRRVEDGPRGQPVRRLLLHQGGPAADAQGTRGTDHQHVQRLGPGGPGGPGQLLLVQGRADRPDQGRRPRGRQPRDHRQRRGAGLHRHRAHAGPARGAAGPDPQADAAGPLRDAWTTSPTPWPSSPPTRRATSRARCSPSTAAW